MSAPAAASRAAADAPPAPRSPWVSFSVVAVGTFMATLDGSIVNVALPTLRRELHATFAGVEWIVAAYLLVISALLLTAGRLGDLAGHRRVYAGGLLLFTLGSGLCGTANGLATLVAARCVQALGAAATMAMGTAIVTANFPRERRGRGLGGIASVVAVGLTLGPPLGGFILQHLSWRWIFLPNVPVGLLGAMWAARVLPRSRRRPARLDRRGALLLAATLGPGMGALQSMHASPSRAGALALAALLAAGLLARHLRRAPDPVLAPALFRDRVFTAGVVSGLLSYAALFASNLLTPFYLAGVKGLAPAALGAMLTSVPLAVSVAAPISGRLSDRFGPRALCLAGMGLLAAGLATLGYAGRDDGLPSIAGRLALCGLGMGLFQAPNNSAVMGTLPREHLGSGGGVLATARNVGMVFGIVLAGLLFRWQGGSSARPDGFLAGYRTALCSGALLAILAGIVSAARDAPSRDAARGPPPRTS